MIARRCQRFGQGGFLLMTSLGLMVVFAIVTVALLSMTITMMRVTESYHRNASDVRAADGAMEIVISQLRLNPDGVGAGCVDSGTHSGYASSYEIDTVLDDGSTRSVIVVCDADSVSSTRRVLSLSARTGATHSLSGVARVRIDDAVGSSPSPGVVMIVCDWQLGKALSASLAACPSA